MYTVSIYMYSYIGLNCLALTRRRKLKRQKFVNCVLQVVLLIAIPNVDELSIKFQLSL